MPYLRRVQELLCDPNQSYWTGLAHRVKGDRAHDLLHETGGMVWDWCGMELFLLCVMLEKRVSDATPQAQKTSCDSRPETESLLRVLDARGLISAESVEHAHEEHADSFFLYETLPARGFS
jgi:hypothetical protein